MEFKRNKKYCCTLKQEGTVKDQIKFVDMSPLFVNDDLSKGLFPVYRTGGRQGVLNKNYHELIYKDISDELKASLTNIPTPNKTTKNILNFEKEKDDFKGL